MKDFKIGDRVEIAYGVPGYSGMTGEITGWQNVGFTTYFVVKFEPDPHRRGVQLGYFVASVLRKVYFC